MSEAQPPETVQEALAEARRHGRTAVAEALAALAALLDAAALAAGREPRAGAWAPFVETLENLRSWLEPDGGPDGRAVLDGIRAALDEEIARWEERSRSEPEARTVLRAFLAVREVVWELAARGAAQPEAAQAPADAPEPRRRTRVQRVHVEG